MYIPSMLPQITFSQTSPTEGVIYKTSLYKQDDYKPQEISVTKKEMSSLELGNQVVNKFRKMDIKSGNQWLNVFPNGEARVKNVYLAAVCEELFKNISNITNIGNILRVYLSQTDNSLINELTQMLYTERAYSLIYAVVLLATKSGSCSSQACLTEEVFRCETSEKNTQSNSKLIIRKAHFSNHEFCMLGDAREGKAIRVDPWHPAGGAHVMSLEEISQITEVQLPVTRPTYKPIFSLRHLDRIEPVKPKIVEKYASDTYGKKLGADLAKEIIKIDIWQRQKGKFPESWHMLFGSEDPATRYRLSNGKSKTFNQMSVNKWENNFVKPTQLLNDFVEEDPKNHKDLEQAGYRAEGSIGAGGKDQ